MNLNRWAVFLITAGAAGFALVSPQPASSTHITGGALPPDLVTLPPKDLSIQVINGQTRVAFDNEIGNDHTGPLAVFPEKIPASGDTDDCNGDGIATNDRKAYQRVYQDKNNGGSSSGGLTTSGLKSSPPAVWSSIRPTTTGTSTSPSTS